MLGLVAGKAVFVVLMFFPDKKVRKSVPVFNDVC
jgi:hypothetical protein